MIQHGTSNMENKTAAVFENRSGFTLFEIMIAIFIFAILLTTVFASYRAVFSRTEAIQVGMPVYEMGSNSLNRMVNDLKLLHITEAYEYKRPDFDDPPDDYRILGDASYSGGSGFSKLHFASMDHVALESANRDGIAQIVYYVTGDDENGFFLMRSDTIYPYEKFEEKNSDPIVCDNVKSFTVIFYDEEGEEHETWDSDSDEFEYKTPRIIKIVLEVGDENYSIAFETAVALPVYR